MATSKEIIRNLLLYEFELGHSAKKAADSINQAKGAGTVCESTAYRWFAKFREGNEALNDKERSGRPRESDREAIIAAIELDPSMSTRMLAEEFDCDNKTIQRILQEAGKVWKKARWVPHALTAAQKQQRVNVATALLTRERATPFLDHIVTGATLNRA